LVLLPQDLKQIGANLELNEKPDPKQAFISPLTSVFYFREFDGVSKIVRVSEVYMGTGTVRYKCLHSGKSRELHTRKFLSASKPNV
jgi:hypothetical protein